MFSFPADWKQGALGTILNRAGFSGVFRYASGTAYTRCPDSPGNLGITSDAGGCSYALALGEFNGARLPPVKEFNLKVTKGFSFRGLDLTVYGDFRNAFNFRNVTRVYSATNGIRNKKLEAIGWTVDSATFAQEAAASGVYDTLGNIDLRFGGAVASGCGNWVDQGGRPLVPNCVYLIRAEERWGNGDHIFDLDEQFRAHRASQLLGLGEQEFTASPRRIRVGVEISF